MNAVIETLMAHRSVRSYTDEPVDEAHVRAAVGAGQMASTSSAVQPYVIIRVRDAAVRAELAELSGPQEKVAHAPAFFVVCGDARRHRLLCDRAGTPYDQRLEAFLVSAIDTALFAQNVCVAFESLGYGICYIGGLRNDVARVVRVLDLPEGVYPFFGLCVGRPAPIDATASGHEAPASGRVVPRPRLPLDAVLMEGGYVSDDAVLAHVDAYDGTYRGYLADRGASPEQAARAWGPAMGSKFAAVSRPDLASCFHSQGARLD